MFSHQTAASILGLPLPIFAQGAMTLHVTVRSGSVPEGNGVRGFELSSDLWRSQEFVYFDRRNYDLFALPVLAPAVVWAQLASTLDSDDLVALGDAMVTGSDPLCSLAELREETRRWTGRRGVRAM